MKHSFGLQADTSAPVLSGPFRCWTGLFVAAVLAFPGVASAHPGHALAQTAYLTLAPDKVRLELQLTVGEDAVAPLLAALDLDRDGTASEAEAQAWAEDVLIHVSLALDDDPTPWILGEVRVPDLALLATGSAALSLTAVAARPEALGVHSLAFVNDYAPAETLRTANMFLEAGEGWSWEVADQKRSDNGAGLTVTYDASQD